MTFPFPLLLAAYRLCRFRELECQRVLHLDRYVLRELPMFQSSNFDRSSEGHFRVRGSPEPPLGIAHHNQILTYRFFTNAASFKASSPRANGAVRHPE